MRSFLRNLSKSCHGQPAAPLSITCRGTPIAHEDLFTYTNGHFLVDEERQFSQRYVRFDLDALCNTVATAGGDPSQVTAIEKMEGGFSKALLMKKANGTEVIAKIPCRIAGPPSLITAGEVGVLEYVRRHTDIPVPRVLSWSDTSNDVGAEYIIMEKAAGVPLFQRWGSMTEFEKLQLIKNLTKLEAQLSAIRFPAYGGLYLRTDVNRPNRLLGDEIDPCKSFCIGPSCDRAFDADLTPGLEPGPWDSISSFGVSIAERELLRVSNGGEQSRSSFYKGTVEQQTQLLKSTVSLMKLLDSNSILRGACQPTMCHTDLHMGNIFVDPNECSKIVSLIDFQSTSILPAFLQAQWPIFLRPPQAYDYVKGIFHPKLPSDF